MTGRFVTHARTLEELRAEFISDVHRRLVALDRRREFASSAAEKSRIAYTERELEDLISYWQSVEVRGSRTHGGTQNG